MSGGETFVREIYIDSGEIPLRIHQRCEGDVGCVVWDGGLVLAKYIDQRNSVGRWNVENHLLELGAGTGVVGLLACCLGNCVVLTDLPEFLPLMRMNVEENKDILKGTVDIRPLEWGSPVAFERKPDVILMGECVYYDKSIEPLVETMTELCGSNTEILVSYEERDGRANSAALAKFLQLAGKAFTVEEVPLEDHHPEFSSADIHILRLRKSSVRMSKT